MRRLLLLSCLFLAPAAPAAAQWGEAPVTDLGAHGIATCLRDAGGGRVASVALRGGEQGVALHTATAAGLRPDGTALFRAGSTAARRLRPPIRERRWLPP